jgi:RNA polymerase sigma-70 factor (ECF subfamily)
MNHLCSAVHLWDVDVMTGVAGLEAQGLIERAASGDPVAFARIVAEHHEDMRRVCAVVCGDDGLAEEAVQAAWLKAWRKLGSVRDHEHLRPWLVSIAVNEAKQLLRKRRRRIEVEATRQALPPHAGTDPATTIDLIDLRAALARLGPDDRALLAMRYVAGFDATELAAAIGLSPPGTRARLARLLARLRRELGHG